MSPIKYLSDLLQFGFTVRHTGGKGGIVTYDEVWRNARFEYEVGMGCVGVYLASARRWRTLFGVPLWRLSEADKARIMERMKRYDAHYVAW